MSTADRQLVALGLVLLGSIVVLPLLFVGAMGFGPLFGGPGMGGHGGPMMGPHGTWGVGDGWGLAVALATQLAGLVVLLGAGYLLYRSLTDRDGKNGDEWTPVR